VCGAGSGLISRERAQRPSDTMGPDTNLGNFVEGVATMATTKWAQYRFVVKEGATEAREVREGFIDLVADPFIVAEPYDNKPRSQYPLEGPDFLALDLAQGTSLDQAEQIADFLNERVKYVSITRFGDADDAARDVTQSEHERRIDSDRFTVVLSMLNDKLKANDVAGATEAMRAVQSVVVDVIGGWAKAVRMSREILAKFGNGEDLNA
jgi:hypothetical protein